MSVIWKNNTPALGPKSCLAFNDQEKTIQIKVSEVNILLEIWDAFIDSQGLVLVHWLQTC